LKKLAQQQDVETLDAKLHYKIKFKQEGIDSFDFINILSRIEYDVINSRFIKNCYINKKNSLKKEISYKTCYEVDFIDEGLLINVGNESVDEDGHNVEQGARILLVLEN